MIKSKLLVGLIFFTIFSLCMVAQDAVAEENVKAVLIYNFTKFLNWPEGEIGDTFNIGVIGNPKIADALNTISQKQSMKNKSAKVVEINSLNEVSKLNLVFLSKESKTSIVSLLDRIKNKPILIISDIEGAAKMGVCINLIKRDDKLKFEINITSLKKHNIQPNTQLINLAYNLYQ